MADELPRLEIGQISTHWTGLHDPSRFVTTYGPAVKKYLHALLRDEHEAEEALQDLLVQVTEKGLASADPHKGRFRDYLKAVVRNAARARLGRKSRSPAGAEALRHLVGPAGPTDAERAWLVEWRACVLEKAWRGLERHQRANAGNLCYTVLRLSVDHPGDDSKQLATRAAAQAGQPLSAEAFRKQVSRARRAFAALIADEVRQTLADPSDQGLREELAAVGLLATLRDYLPGGQSPA